MNTKSRGVHCSMSNSKSCVLDNLSEKQNLKNILKKKEIYNGR